MTEILAQDGHAYVQVLYSCSNFLIKKLLACGWKFEIEMNTYVQYIGLSYNEFYFTIHRK